MANSVRSVCVWVLILVGASFAAAPLSEPRYGPSSRRCDQPVPPADSLSPVNAPGAAGTDVSLGGSNEPSIAINPLNPLNVAASSLWESRVSSNGGVTWSAALGNSVPAAYGNCGDSVLAFDSQGRLFDTYLGCHFSGGLDVFVSRLNPGGGGFLAGPFAASTSGVSGIENDKQWLAADHFPGSPFVDRLYLAWTEFSSGGTRVLTSYSTNQGATWSVPLRLSAPFGAEGFVWPTHVAVAPNGNVYVSYHSQTGFFCNPNGTSGKVYVSRSTDGGVTFPQKTMAFAAGAADITYNIQDCPDGVVPGAQFWTQGSNQAFVLPDPQVPGNVYVVAADDSDNNHGVGDASDIYVARSTNSGSTWGAPIRVDDGPSGTFQFFPAAAIDDVTGCIAVLWYDNRGGALNTSGHYLLDAYYSISTDRGLTWNSDVKINDATFDPDRGAPSRFPGPPPTLRIGEYIGVAFDSGTIHAIWTGNTVFGQQVITDSAVDACLALPDAALADPSGIDKVRFISFSVPPDATPPAAPSALRVILTSLHHPNPPYSGGTATDFTAFEGQIRWVGPPAQYIESSASGETLFASLLQCTPYYQDWSTVGLLHVTGSAIVPSSTYQVENLGISCQGNEAGCTAVSAALPIATTRWGDVETPYNPPSPDPQPDTADISALVDKFRSAIGALIKARALLADPVPEMEPDLGFAHISACVDAFKGAPYPHTIASCP